mmetsp:Transcript_64197/g.168004  ORF Transcript_64197/g.168004 Transcript_64197/m.168004 type:complete len:236 (+) Transcript_64197:1934-2641(+)
MRRRGRRPFPGYRGGEWVQRPGIVDPAPVQCKCRSPGRGRLLDAGGSLAGRSVALGGRVRPPRHVRHRRRIPAAGPTGWDAWRPADAGPAVPAGRGRDDGRQCLPGAVDAAAGVAAAGPADEARPQRPVHDGRRRGDAASLRHQCRRQRQPPGQPGPEVLLLREAGRGPGRARPGGHLVPHGAGHVPRRHCAAHPEGGQRADGVGAEVLRSSLGGAYQLCPRLIGDVAGIAICVH